MILFTCRGTAVDISPHAMHRFKERAVLVYPGGQLDSDERARDLLALKIRRAGIRNRRPGWAYSTRNLSHRSLTDGYIVLSEAVAFPLQKFNGRLTAMTCIVRGWDRSTIEAS